MDFDPIAYINEPRWQESRLGLGRIRALLDRMGRPQDRMRFVHVAGTNGKGSTCAFLSSILQASGYRTGLFTSPFIETFEERIRVDGANIALADLTAVTLAVKDHAEALAAETGDHPTEFELMTAVAVEHFARSGCDIAVLEVGLGGRLDSTNVIDAPEVAVIARIGLDHTALLGTTLAAVAGEKAGIVKPGSRVVSWPQEPEAMAVVERAVETCGDQLIVPDFSQLRAGAVERAEDAAADGSEASGATFNRPGTCAPDLPIQNVSRETFVRLFSYKHFTDLETRLLGSYQPANAALAIEAALALRAGGWDIPDDAVRAGVAQASWPGRFEVLPHKPGEPAFVIDGGHNPQGAQALADSLRDVFPGKKPVFVIGVLEDKDYPAMLEAVLPLGSAFVCVAPENPRALSAAKLARAIRWTGQDLLGCSACVKPYEARDFDDALAKARALAGPDGLVCAFGSLYSVGAFKERLKGTREA